MSDIPLTEAEQVAKKELDKASKDLQSAFAKKMQHAGGIDLMGMLLTMQMLTTQLDVFFSLMAESEPLLRERFWHRLAEAFDKVTLEFLKQVIISPSPQRKQ